VCWKIKNEAQNITRREAAAKVAETARLSSSIPTKRSILKNTPIGHVSTSARLQLVVLSACMSVRECVCVCVCKRVHVCVRALIIRLTWIPLQRQYNFYLSSAYSLPATCNWQQQQPTTKNKNNSKSTTVAFFPCKSKI